LEQPNPEQAQKETLAQTDFFSKTLTDLTLLIGGDLTAENEFCQKCSEKPGTRGCEKKITRQQCTIVQTPRLQE
jgi:hypothetical protein